MYPAAGIGWNPDHPRLDRFKSGGLTMRTPRTPSRRLRGLLRLRVSRQLDFPAAGPFFALGTQTAYSVQLDGPDCSVMCGTGGIFAKGY